MQRRLSVALFFATVVTTLGAGSLMEGADPFHDPFALLEGTPFAASLLLILGAHELSHFVTSRRHGVHATWPLFIPAPSLIGTFGAVIRIKSPIPDRRALLEIGAAGPIAGFIVALPLAVVGLSFSRLEMGALPADAASLSLGNSLLFSLLTRLVLGPLPDDVQLYLHPMAFAAWIGFFVTALNLLPVGQLDGGHVLYALCSRRQKTVSQAVVALLAPLGFWWWGWFLWVGMLMILGLRHPPVVAEEVVLAGRHRLLGVAAAVLLVLTFTPLPFRI